MPRDLLLRELARLMRSSGEFLNVAEFVVEHAGELAPLLHTTELDLRNAAGQPDDAVVRAVRPRLQRALDNQREQRRDAAAATARNAAVELGRTARWHERGVVLDEGLVLGPLIADLRTKHVAFTLPDITVTIDTDLLRRARLLQRTYMDLAVFVNSDGLVFVWKAGRGRLRLISRKLVPAAMRAALVVPIPPPAQHQVPTFAGAVGELAAAQ